MNKKITIYTTLFLIFRVLDHYTTYLVLGDNLGSASGPFQEVNPLVRDYGFNYTGMILHGLFIAALYIGTFIYSEKKFRLEYPEDAVTPLKRLKYYCGIKGIIPRIANFIGFWGIRGMLISQPFIIINNYLYYYTITSSEGLLKELSLWYYQMNYHTEIEYGFQFNNYISPIVYIIVIYLFYRRYIVKY